VLQRFRTPAVVRFSDLSIGRSLNAGIVDESVTLGTGLTFVEHFHCNGWSEKERTFTSFTGTFQIGETKYHYTITDPGDGKGTGAWQGAAGKPVEGAFAMQIRTQNKLDALTKDE